MVRRSSAAVAALALTALGACADPSAPDAAPSAVDVGPSLSRAAARSGDDLPVLASAHVNRSEPQGIPDRVRFNITLRFGTPPTEAQRATFEEAAARWQRIIIADNPSISGSFPANYCIAGAPAFSGTIDDVMIDVLLVPIDGPGRILGAAGPCVARASDNLPAYGIMMFDTADLDRLATRGQLDETIVHEMGHVLGIGTLWNYQRSLRTPGPDFRFVGQYANVHFNSVGGDGLVPVENTGGAGTIGAHWRESAFDNELMTGFLNSGRENPLSRVTAASLRDMGYGTAVTAEAYKLPAPTAAAAMEAGGAAALLDGLDIAASEVLFGAQAVVLPPTP